MKARQTVALPALERVADRRRANVLLRPLRLRILQLAREPASAAQIADTLGHPRQNVNYHVRALARAGFLRKAGTRRKRNMTEQRYRATATAYVLDPALLGPVAPDLRTMTDAFSATHLLALTTRAQAELTTAWREARGQGKRLATLSIASEVRFEHAAQREAFSRALERAIVEIVATHASPFTAPDGSRGKGRPYRLVLGCYPIPPNMATAEAAEPGT